MKQGDFVQYQITLSFPGADLSFPDDQGLLAGRYAMLSLQGQGTVLMATGPGSVPALHALGKPHLPCVRWHIQVPSSVLPDQVQVHITPKGWVPVRGHYHMAPVQAALHESFRPGQETDPRRFCRHKPTYEADADFSYPLIHTLLSLQGLKVLEIHYTPLRYNPVQRRLMVSPEATLTVRYPAKAVHDATLAGPFQQMVDRLTLSAVWSECRGVCGTKPPKAGKFVVITGAKLATSKVLKAWMDYRTRQGYSCLATLLCEQGDVTRQLKQLYAKDAFQYVVVVGDDTVVPIPSDTETGYHYKTWANLSGNDDLNDVALGVFLADNDEKLQNIFNHQQWQEAGGPWGKTVMATAGPEDDGPVWSRFCSAHVASLPFDHPKDGLGYQVHRVYQHVPYEQYGGPEAKFGCPVTSFEPWTLTPSPFIADGPQAVKAIVDHWNRGVALIGHRDHGLSTGPENPALSFSLFNGPITSTCSPFFTSISCSTGEFKESHEKSFVYQATSSPYGTCATVAATRWSSTGDNDFNYLAMWETLLPKGEKPSINTVGAIYLAGQLKAESHGRTFFHLFGDPMTRLSLGRVPTTPP